MQLDITTLSELNQSEKDKSDDFIHSCFQNFIQTHTIKCVYTT